MGSRSNEILLFFVSLSLFPLAAMAASPQELVRNGNAAYERGQYDKALEAYAKADVNGPSTPWIVFNKGAAYYRKREFARARDAWLKAASQSRDLRLQANCFFNLGNCAVQEAKEKQKSDPEKAMNTYARSVTCFQQALHLIKEEGNNGYAQLKRDASENIEMVRLIMQSISETIDKQKKRSSGADHPGDRARKSGTGKNHMPQGLAAPEQLRKKDQALKQDSMQMRDARMPPSKQIQTILLARMPDDAQSIINKEEERERNRERGSAVRSRGIDKDW